MDYTKKDHAIIALRAALNAVPAIGGSVASLIGDYVPLSTERAVTSTLQLLSEELSRLEGRIDPNAVNKEEFADLFKSCYLIIVRSSHEIRHRAAASLLTNILLSPDDPAKVSYTELDHLVRCLDSLSIGAIHTLGAAVALARAQSIQPNGEGNIRFNFEQLTAQLGNLETSLAMGLVSELNGYNLLRFAEQPSIRTPKYGNLPIEITPLGFRFVTRFIEAET